MAKRKSKFKTPDSLNIQAALEAGKYTEQDQFIFDQKQARKLARFYDTPEALKLYLSGDKNTTLQLFSDGGKVKFIQNKLPSKQDVAHIDWINFTCNAESYNTDFAITDDELIVMASAICKSIFGFGITVKRPNGAFFYNTSYELGDGYGLLCYGGQNNTLLVSINGTGCGQCSLGWQLRLYRFLEAAISPTITRIDLTHDIYDAPDFTIDHFRGVYDRGGFTTYRNPPSISMVGNWHTKDQKGRTLYIGSRTAGLYLRIYEKGKQVQSQDKPTWLRFEAELKSCDRIIPHDVLLNPHEYLAGTYPALRFINHKQTHIEKQRHEVRADFDHRVKWAKRQSGGFLHLLIELGYSQAEILEMLEGEKVPKAFRQKFLDNPNPSICEQAAQIDSTQSLPNLNFLDIEE
ncbi:replication initiation factor domain-containing protein [Methylophilus glucosoxydans]|uniref:Replication initiation factor domain-containing protein n=1 Tax=Methylophilus glucosoxydans TaxID=752553 RepID=A0ABW3GHW9_9PROT